MSATTIPTQRLASLDALRGFDMFWVIGGAALQSAFLTLSDHPVGKVIAEQVTHVKWEGSHAYDLGFPVFIFVAGVSLAFSLPRSVERVGRSQTAWRLARRALLLFVIGILYNGRIHKGLDEIRWLGVLQRIALATFGAGLLSIWLRGRWLIVVTIALLVGYWALVAFVPFPGGTPGDFAEGRNIVNWFDAHFLPGRKTDGDHDSEGILSTIPAVATALLGLLAGMFLRDSRLSGTGKSLWLLASGTVLVALGMLWSLHFPLIKNIWTSSFVLVACGWSAILLGAFHQIMEVWNYRKWAAPFVWVGLNPITIYLATRFVNFDQFSKMIAGPGPGFTRAILTTGFGVLLAWALHRKRIYIRI